MIAVLLVVTLCRPDLLGPARDGRPERSALQTQTISEIRVQGNATVTDETVISLAGVSVGMPLGADTIAAITKRLRDSGRFDEVDVRQRYRTLEMDQVALLIIVHERPGTSPTGQPPSTLRRLRNHLMFFPIVDYDEGYGWTYGMQTSIVGVMGRRERFSVPLSWGATRRAAVEVERPFKSGPLTRLVGSFGVARTENPHFVADDRRTTFNVRAERRLFGHLTLGAAVGHDSVHFAPEDSTAAAAEMPDLRGPAYTGPAYTGPAINDHFWSTGADVTFDTRIDPSYPVDAVLASASVERLMDRGSELAAQGINRYRLNVAGYKRVFRQIVFAAHTEYDTASAALPDYEQWLLGGSSLRGTHAGTFAGDKRLLWGGEVRAPLGSPMDLAKLGVNAFLDGGTVAPYGQSISHAATERGAGAGVFIIATVVRLNFEVAHSLNHRGTRFRFGMGFTF